MAQFFTISWGPGDEPMAVSTEIVREDHAVVVLAEPVVLPNGVSRKLVFKGNLPWMPYTPAGAARLTMADVTDQLIEARAKVALLEQRAAKLCRS